MQLTMQNQSHGVAAVPSSTEVDLFWASGRHWRIRANRDSSVSVQTGSDGHLLSYMMAAYLRVET
jgi:hypothetical protein